MLFIAVKCHYLYTLKPFLDLLHVKITYELFYVHRHMTVFSFTNCTDHTIYINGDEINISQSVVTMKNSLKVT